MVKLKDIADRLNLSVSTVSRVVNNLDRVDPKTRRRVQDALAKYNYQPNENARRLKTNVSNVVGVIVPDISNPFYATLIKGIEDVLYQSGYTVILCNTDDSPERERDSIALLMRQKVAGLVVATILPPDTVADQYAAASCPVVFVDNVPLADPQVQSVSIDNARAAMQLVQYMLAQGHRRIYMISGPVGESSADERLQGWKSALLAAGITPGEDWYCHGDFREKAGHRAMKRFLAHAQRPSAVCIANNFMAYGAVKAIYEAGLRVPEDISIGAFDVIDTTGLMRLDITTILQPAEQIGRTAADMCLQAAARGAERLGRRMVLAHQLCPNATVRKL